MHVPIMIEIPQYRRIFCIHNSQPFPFFKLIPILQVAQRRVFACIFILKKDLLPILAAAPTNVTPIVSPFFTNLSPLSNTDPNRLPSRPG